MVLPSLSATEAVKEPARHGVSTRQRLALAVAATVLAHSVMISIVGFEKNMCIINVIKRIKITPHNLRA
jgi:hypothetical protein